MARRGWSRQATTSHSSSTAKTTMVAALLPPLRTNRTSRTSSRHITGATTTATAIGSTLTPHSRRAKASTVATAALKTTGRHRVPRPTMAVLLLLLALALTISMKWARCRPSRLLFTRTSYGNIIERYIYTNDPSLCVCFFSFMRHFLFPWCSPN